MFHAKKVLIKMLFNLIRPSSEIINDFSIKLNKKYLNDSIIIFN